MRRHVPPLIAALTSIVGSVAIFAILVAVLRPGRGSREYLAITLWSVPLAVSVGLVASVLRRRLSGRSVLARCTGALISGALTDVVGLGGFGLVASPDGSRLYVAGGPNVKIVDRLSRTLIDSLVVGGGAVRIALSPDGGTAFVANQAGWVNVIY